jgi:hypothetical protein
VKDIKRSYWIFISIGIVVLSAYLLAYVISEFFTTVHLTVFVGGGPSHIVIPLNDSLLDHGSPKLKGALINAAAEKKALGYQRAYTVDMSMQEFHAMNQMLISTKEGEELAKETPNPSPTVALWPKYTWIVIVNYNGTTYQMECTYSGVPPLGQSWFD